MGLPPLNFTKYSAAVQTQLSSYGKPFVAWVVIAVVVNRVWGKSILIIYALGSLLIYVKIGPDIPLLKMLEGKTVVIVSMLLSNSYFKMVNPYWLGLYAGFCLFARDWNLLSKVNQLDGLNADLKIQTQTLEEAKNKLSTQLSDVRSKFSSLLAQARATETSRNAADAAETELKLKVQQTEETLDQKLKDIEDIVQIIVSDPDFHQRMQELERVQKQAEELQTQNARTHAKYEAMLVSFTQLASELTGVLSQLNQYQGQYRAQVEQIQKTLGQLQQNIRPLPS